MKPTIRHGIQPPRLPQQFIPTVLEAVTDQAQYSQCSLANADLSGQAASDVLFEGVLNRRLNFIQTRWTHLRLFDSRLERCDLSGAMWEQARLRRVELAECRLLGVNLCEANFEDVRFTDCNGAGAIFVSAVFKAVRFEKCNFREASFAGAELGGAVFWRCDLSHADFREAKLNGADFSASVIDGMQVGVQEMKGAIIAPEQAVQVVGLLGVLVKESNIEEDNNNRLG